MYVLVRILYCLFWQWNCLALMLEVIMMDLDISILSIHSPDLGTYR